MVLPKICWIIPQNDILYIYIDIHRHIATLKNFDHQCAIEHHELPISSGKTKNKSHVFGRFIAPKATLRKVHHCSTSETTHISHALPRSTAGKDRGALPASLSPASPAAAPHGPGGSHAVSERAEAVADFFLKAELPSCRALDIPSGSDPPGSLTK